MSYEVKRVIEFGQENRKPVGLLKGAVLLKDGTEPVLQLKLRNNGKDILNRLSVKITCLGKDGQVKGVQSYTYEKIFVTSGMEFGTDVAIPLNYKDIESVSVEIEKDLEALRVSSKESLKKQWNPAWFPKTYNISIALLAILFLMYHIIVLISWNRLIKGQINYSPWIFGSNYGRTVQIISAIFLTTAIYLYPMTQILLNKNRIDYQKLLLSNILQILVVVLSVLCGGIAGILAQYYLYLIGSITIILVHTVMIEDIRNRMCFLLVGAVMILITFIFFYGLFALDSVIIICEYLKLSVNIIGVIMIIKKKFKLV